MARAKAQDFLHNFRFYGVVQGFGEAGVTAQLGTDTAGPSAGFNSVSTPEASHDAVEYREGHYIYTQKFVGIPTISDISLTRGVALQDGTFWKWMREVIEAGTEYRADLSIYHLHRDSKSQTLSTLNETMQKLTLGPSDKGFIEYQCKEAFPIRHKVSGDLDATASEVSIQELDLAIEYFNVVDHGPIEG